MISYVPYVFSKNQSHPANHDPIFGDPPILTHWSPLIDDMSIYLIIFHGIWMEIEVSCPSLSQILHQIRIDCHQLQDVRGHAVRVQRLDSQLGQGLWRRAPGRRSMDLPKGWDEWRASRNHFSGGFQPEDVGFGILIGISLYGTWGYKLDDLLRT